MKEIECKNLVVGYDGHIAAENISFTVERGDYFFIVGENGSGKSTLLKTILGLIKPLAGTLDFPNGLKNKETGYVPQQTEAQRDFPATVYEIVLSGCLSGCGFNPFYTKNQKILARKNMEITGVTELSERCFAELSGGQRQRTLIARALCAANKTLVLDEPTAGLDPIVTQELYDLTERLNKERGMTILTVSHDMKAAAKYAFKVLVVGKPCRLFGAEEFIKSDYYKKTEAIEGQNYGVL